MGTMSMGCNTPVGKPDMKMKRLPSEANSGRVTDPGKESSGVDVMCGAPEGIEEDHFAAFPLAIAWRRHHSARERIAQKITQVVRFLVCARMRSTCR